MTDAPAPALVPIDDADALAQIAISLRLNIHRLPQLKGKGAIVGADARDSAIAILAEALFNDLKRGNLIFGRDPAKFSSTAIGSAVRPRSDRDDDTAAIPFGPLPRAAELETQKNGRRGSGRVPGPRRPRVDQ
jgi:hypothetical protein